MLLAAATAALSLAACSRGERQGHGGRGTPLRVAAASDLAIAFGELGPAFERESGKRVEVTYGSTGLMAKQIAEGAPFHVFAAANIAFVDDVVREGACHGETKALYARGRLALWAKDEASLPRDLGELRDGRFAKIAIANPEHAPYGRAARQALVASGTWAQVEKRAVYGENVQQALVFASSGNAEVSIVALSLAMGSGGAFRPIDPALHEPLDQALVACKGGTAGEKANEARSFIAFVSSDAGRAIMRKHGFLLPGESPPASARASDDAAR